MRKGIIKFLLVMLSVSFCFLSVTARTSTLLPARFSAEAYSSTHYLVGQADLMLPLKGDAAHNFYIDPALAYGSESQGYADLGVGYRWIKNSSAILGGYLFAGYSRIDNNARLWVVNPGIEALGSRWDAHLNGYLVGGDRNTAVSSFLTFDEFSGHSELLNLFDVTQHAGDGVDVKLGYQLFSRTPLKAYVGSYFFSPAATNNVLGGAIGLEYWLDRNIKVFANYTYDNLRRSVGAFGIGVELGGAHIHRSDPSVEERMTDPVERYLSELGQGSAIPSQKATQLIGQVVPPDMDHIAFFSQTGTPNNGGMNLTIQNCTFDNPCGPTDLTNQGTATLESLLPNTEMLFTGGTYAALDVLNGTNPVTIRTGQSIASAPGTPLSTFEGGFILEGDNSLNNIILEPTVNTAMGAGVSALGGNVAINDSQIGSMATPFATGLALSGNTQADLNNSTVFASSTGVNVANSASLRTDASMINVNGGANSIGINSTSSGPLSITDGSSIIVQGGDDSVGIGLSNGDIDLTNSTVTLIGGNDSIGFISTGSGIVNVDTSSVNVTGGDSSVGLITTGSGPVTVSGSQINLTGGANSVGYTIDGSGAVHINGDSTITVNAGQNNAVGLMTTSSSTNAVTLNGANINVTGGDNSVGLSTAGSGPVTVNGGSQVNLTGGANSVGYVVDGSGAVNINGSSTITVNAGQNNAVGLTTTSSSTNDVTLNGANINVTGGANSFGLNTAGSGPVTVSGSQINLTGGANSVGYQVDGSGAVNINGSSTITVNAAGQTSVAGLATTSSSTSNVTLSGTQIIVFGGANSNGVNVQGSGNINLTGSVITMNAAGASNVNGITAFGGNNTLNGTQINVTQANNNSNGILVDGNGTFDLANTSVINISGTGTLSGIAAVNSIVAIGNHAITGSNVNVIVATDSADQAIGLVARNASKITLDGVDIDVSGNPSSLISFVSGIGSVTLTGTNVCMLNGNAVTC